MFAIAGIIGTGDEDDAYRPDVQGSGGPCIIPSNPDGSPKFNWCLIKLRAPDKATGKNLFKIGDKLDLQRKDMPVAQKTGITNKLEGMGISSLDITDETTVREIVKKIGRHLDVNFKDLGGVI